MHVSAEGGGTCRRTDAGCHDECRALLSAVLLRCLQLGAAEEEHREALELCSQSILLERGVLALPDGVAAVMCVEGMVAVLTLRGTARRCVQAVRDNMHAVERMLSVAACASCVAAVGGTASSRV